MIKSALYHLLPVICGLVLYVASYLMMLHPWTVAGRFRYHRIPQYSLFGRSVASRSFVGRIYAPAQYVDEHLVRPTYWKKGIWIPGDST